MSSGSLVVYFELEYFDLKLSFVEWFFKWWIIKLAYALISALAVSISVIFGILGFSWENLSLYLFMLLMVGIVYWIFIGEYVQMKIKWQTTQTSQEYRWEISSRQITICNENAVHEFFWEHVFRIDELRNSFRFYLNNHDHFVLPKRALTSVEIKQLQQLITNAT
jgi:hypothetical protein